MTYKQLVAKIASVSGDSKAAVGRFFDSLEAVVHEELAAGEKVTLPGLGTLTVRDAAARTVKSPMVALPKCRRRRSRNSPLLPP